MKKKIKLTTSMRNAFSGYTYQHIVTTYFIAKMDVEREISKIEIEAITEDNFDDLILTKDAIKYHFQLKDFKEPKIDDIIISPSECRINGKVHKLSSDVNILFFKEIPLTINSSIFQIPSMYKDGVHIISLSRENIYTFLQ